jgi:hypothetical protein
MSPAIDTHTWGARAHARGSRMRGVSSGSSRTSRRAAQEPVLSTRDLFVLGWVCEQYGARADQLELLLGCGSRTVQRLLARLRDAGLIGTRRLLVGESVWAIPTSRGMRAAGQGFGIWHPRLGGLAHVAAVTDVRLYIHARSPQSDWVSERVLAREREPGEHLPDGVVVTEDGQRVVIEVELTVKSQHRVRLILDELSARFDTVLYFCAPGPFRQLSKLAETGQWPKLGVRELPRPQIALAS